MLNSYKEITNKYLKHGRKRTVLTIIGIVLSVALISAIGLFLRSMQLGEIEKMKADWGALHIYYDKPSDELISKIKNNIKVDRSGSYAEKDLGKISDKYSLIETQGTDKALELLPFKVKKGEFPKREGEVAFEEWALNIIDNKANIGDKITIKDRTFTLSGILKNKVESQQKNSINILTNVANISGEKALLVEMKDKAISNNTVKELKELGEKYGAVAAENVYVLSMYGVGENDALKGLISMAAIVISIVVVASIIVIYNSFNISVVERIKQFGMLRAIGMTPKQIRSMVLREGTILGLIGVPIGLLCGVIALYAIKFVFDIIGADSIMGLKAEVSPIILGISAGVGLISIYISAFLPAFFAGRVSPLVAISSRATISKEKIKKKKSFIAKKIFGFEGMMAVKNMKRSRKRYRSTVLSIVISIVLFVTFKYFMDLTLTINGRDNEASKVDLTLSYNWREKKLPDNFMINDNIIDEIKSTEGVNKVYKRYGAKNFNVAMSKEKELSDLKDFEVYKRIDFQGKESTLMNASLETYDDEMLEACKKYVSSGSIDVENFKNSNSVILVESFYVYSEKLQNSYKGKATNLKVGDEIVLKEDEDFNKGEIKKVKIGAIVKDRVFNNMGSVNGITIIGSKNFYENLNGVKDIKPQKLEISMDKSKKAEAIISSVEKIKDKQDDLKLVNNIDSNKEKKTAVLMVQILVYGFIIVVALIGAVNIINTITTNIILRKREFAALKAIGLTQGSLKKTIMLEGVSYGIMGTIYGAIISTGLAYLMFMQMSKHLRKTAWIIPWQGILIAGIAAIVIGYLSTLSPLARVNRDNLIDSIREDG